MKLSKGNGQIGPEQQVYKRLRQVVLNIDLKKLRMPQISHCFHHGRHLHKHMDMEVRLSWRLRDHCREMRTLFHAHRVVQQVRLGSRLNCLLLLLPYHQIWNTRNRTKSWYRIRVSATSQALRHTRLWIYPRLGCSSAAQLGLRFHNWEGNKGLGLRFETRQGLGL